MIDPVRVLIHDGKYEQTVERDYAVAMDLEILEGEPVMAHGRLRGITRAGGRRVKPRTTLPRAGSANNPEPADDLVGEEPGGVAADDQSKEG